MTTNTDIITAEIIDAAYRIHRDLGPGLLESVYERVLWRFLVRKGLHVERQVPVTFEYDGLTFEKALTIDLLVNGCVVIEIKAAESTLPVFRRQTFTYLRLMNLQVGLLLNFGAATMKEGTARIVNGYKATPQSRLRINRPTALSSEAAAPRDQIREQSPENK